MTLKGQSEIYRHDFFLSFLEDLTFDMHLSHLVFMISHCIFPKYEERRHFFATALIGT